MQRNYRFMWLALIPLGAAGAFATGMVPLPWQLSDERPLASASLTSGAVKQAAVQQAQPTSSAGADGVSGKPLPFGIDVVRLSGIGASVMAGYGKPGSPMTVMADGKPIGVVIPDAQGDWVLVTSHKFANLDPKITLKIGDHFRKTVAALDSAANGADGPTRTSSDAPKRSAADVTRQMLLRLKKLTEEAQADAESAISNASKSPQQRASYRPSPSAPSTRKAVVTGSVTRQPAATAQLPGSAGPATATSTPTVPANASRRTATPRQVATAAPLTAKTKRSAKSLPVPVQFVYRRADFTDQGREAAALLLKYFKAKNFQSVVLSGHADERGTASANQALSRQRLLRIRDLLRDGGFKGQLKLVPKGESEKYRGVDRSRLEAGELYQLDRRVEVMSAR